MLGLMCFIFGTGSGCNKEKPEPGYPDSPYNGRTTAQFNPDKSYGTVTDIDGNIYKTIEIGTQTWMAENLRVTHYLNGDAIPDVTDSTEWKNLDSGAFCNYDNTSDPDTIASFGRLYNWYAIDDSRKIAPKGWHVPEFDEWYTLINYLGGDSLAADHLKEVGDMHWIGPNYSDNSSGFTALPGGWRYYSEPFDWIGIYGTWWMSTEYDKGGAIFNYMYYSGAKVFIGANYKKNGYSIRCIKD